MKLENQDKRQTSIYRMNRSREVSVKSIRKLHASALTKMHLAVTTTTTVLDDDCNNVGRPLNEIADSVHHQ